MIPYNHISSDAQDLKCAGLSIDSEQSLTTSVQGWLFDAIHNNIDV